VKTRQVRARLEIPKSVIPYNMLSLLDQELSEMNRNAELHAAIC